MANQFTTTSTTGYGSRIANSIGGVIFGLLLFVGSFAVLYFNEGRVDMSSIAKKAIVVDASAVSSDASLNGKLVSVTGVVGSSQSIGDNLFFVPGNYIAVERKVEMYSWVEVKNSTTTNNTGGSSTTTTTYNYKEDWEESPSDSSGFQHPDGHLNPQKSLQSYINHATVATVGAYSFDPTSATLPALSSVQLSAQNTMLSQGAVLANENYLFISNNKNSTIGGPMIGDLRVSYYVLSPGFTGTIFGALNGGNIESYTDQNNNSLYRLFNGTREQGIATLHSEYELWLWILRGVGFAMMWIGLLLLFGPIITVLDIFPILGGIAGALVGLATFPVALILTLVTIIVSMIIHSIVAVIIALVITVAIIVAVLVFFRERKKKTSSTLPPPTVPTHS